MGRLVALLRTFQPVRALGDELEPRLAEAIWPGVEVASDVIVRAIADRLGDGDAAKALDALFLTDLALACGCADGDPVALAAFDAHCGPVIERAIAAARVPAADRADVGQIVRRRLLTAPQGERPRIATYSARGSLKAWVRVVAIREAARLLAGVGRERPAEDDELDRLIARDDDPELAYLKRLYSAELKRAFAIAVEALEPRDRLVLRQHMIDGLGIDQLAALHHVHRSTAARWIEGAREAMLAATQRELLRQLRITRTELASIVRLISSQLDLSLPRLLR
ncbi:MAG: putative DNA-binding regulatory protein [Myxococcales bacterium]|nr:putative DNA-binding regulatory protein [Myxococcales bacterium]